MKYNGVIQRRLDLIAQRVSKMRSRAPLTAAQLEDDFFFRSGVERTLQVCIEAMIDVANRIICLENRPASTDAFSSLQQLQDLHVIADAERYRNMVRFRNLIVHRYEQVRTEVLVTIVNGCLDDFDHFAREIAQHERP